MGGGKLTLTALSYRLIVAAALAATTYACTKADALVDKSIKSSENTVANAQATKPLPIVKNTGDTPESLCPSAGLSMVYDYCSVPINNKRNIQTYASILQGISCQYSVTLTVTKPNGSVIVIPMSTFTPTTSGGYNRLYNYQYIFRDYGVHLFEYKVYTGTVPSPSGLIESSQDYIKCVTPSFPPFD
jgi:hypothetical protein